jgi:hypothetical protein
MATDQTAPATPPQSPPRPGDDVPQEIRIISHSMMFYWWPVWVVGFLMALLTLFDGTRMALVPSGSLAYRDFKYDQDGQTKVRDAIIVPEGKNLLPTEKDANGQLLPVRDPHHHVAATASYGVVFATVLLLVIVITNVPLRGLWSFVVIIIIALMSVIFALAGWWDNILYAFSLLDIRINMGGYFFISAVLCGIWAVTTFFFDRQIYMSFTPGQFKVHTEIGGGESSFDTMGMVIEKKRDDLFRHWILGLGSGDLIVRTSGATAQEFSLHNVLFVGKKLQLITQMQRDRPVVKAQ